MTAEPSEHDLAEIRARHGREIRRIAKQHGARKIQIVGSYAKGTQHLNSDFDVLVDINHDNVPALAAALRDLLQLTVHVLTPQGFKAIGADHAYKDALRDAVTL